MIDWRIRLAFIIMGTFYVAGISMIAMAINVPELAGATTSLTLAGVLILTVGFLLGITIAFSPKEGG